MNESELIFYMIGAVFIGAIIIGIARENAGGKYAKPLPNKPQMLTKPVEMAGNFDSTALQTARAMEIELEKYPDTTSRTLALAEMLHRQKAYELRQADRIYQQERKEADALDRVLGIVDRIMPRNNPTPFRSYDPYHPEMRRINNHPYDRAAAEQEYWHGGYWK